MSKQHKKNKVPTISQIVAAYNKFEMASITWSRKEQRLKLYDKHLTPVTAEWINELLIISKKNNEYGGSITVKTLKKMKDTMLEFDDFLQNLDENLNEEDREYFDLPWLDDPIDEEVMKDFNEEYDDDEPVEY